MKIALLGYGKMGKTIEEIAKERGHEVVLKIDKDTKDYDITIADVAIEFSTPDSAFENIKASLQKKIPVVAGTTGWLKHYDEACEICLAEKTAFLYASNFSVGVNIFFKLNHYLSKIMNHQKDYAIDLTEIHHTQKLDAPSGTAITLAEQIIANTSKEAWFLQGETPKQNAVPIKAIREVDVPGTHIITYTSAIDEIQIKHAAFSRKGFALGAVIAAEWILGKQGVFGMGDVLEF